MLNPGPANWATHNKFSPLHILCLQSSTDFARMLQALDDQCFDAAQHEFEMLQQPNDCEAIDAC